MTNPLRVMDPQVSLQEYLLEANLPNLGPFVMIDEDNAVRRIAKELGQDLSPETCYLEQLWVRVDPTPVDEGGGGGTAPDWVPADAKIHIDLVGGTPQGRAWVDGTGEVAVETLLGSDPNTDNAWGTTSYDSANLTADGYVWSASGDGAIAFLGVLRAAVVGGSTSVIRTKTLALDVAGVNRHRVQLGRNFRRNQWSHTECRCWR
jgi:hypothetical protein